MCLYQDPFPVIPAAREASDPRKDGATCGKGRLCSRHAINVGVSGS
jgi:hypothetical protein